MSWLVFLLPRSGDRWDRIPELEVEVRHAPGVTAAVCLGGRVERPSPTVLRVRRAPFEPDRDLTVYFAQP